MKNEKEFLTKANDIQNYLKLGYTGADVWRMFVSHIPTKNDRISYSQFMRLIKKHDLVPKGVLSKGFKGLLTEEARSWAL